jgi:hypothetical protein
MWLQLYMHQIVVINLNNRHFPSSSYKDGEAQITRGCQTYGEAASTISIDQNVSQRFELYLQFGNHKHCSMKTLRIREENPAAWYSNNVRQPVITPNALSQSIK